MHSNRQERNQTAQIDSAAAPEAEAAAGFITRAQIGVGRSA